MGRDVKRGIDYFNIEVRFMEHYKIDILNSKVGMKGIAVLFLLYASIHYQGYYIEFKNIDLLYRLINKNYYTDKLSKEEMNHIFESLIEGELIDKDLFDIDILTSKEVQEHYYMVTRKRKNRDLSKYWLLTKFEMEELDRHSNLKKLEHDLFISTSENDIFTSESTQSKSNSSSKRKRDKSDKLDKLDISTDGAPEFHYLTKSLIKYGYIEIGDLDIIKYNLLFEELLNNYDFKIVFECTKYIVKYAKDAYPTIDDRLDFFKKAIINNIDMLERMDENGYKTSYDYFQEKLRESIR